MYQSGTLFKTTDYAGEFIYENGDLQFIQHEEGRIVPASIAGPAWDYQYHLKDHLGNTRSTFTSGVYTSGYLATFEDATYAQDTTDFFNVDPRVPYPVGGKAVRLNSAAPIGPGFATAVSRGDTISMSVKAYYEDISGFGTSPVAVANIASALTTAFGGVNGAGASDAQQAIYDIFNNDPAVTNALLSGNSNSDSYPSAYLNYLLFDSDNTIVDAGYFGVQAGANLEQTISVSDLIINQAGFIYIYLSNESASSNYVFFDNLDVAISESPVLETTDYYPFGLTFNSYTKPGTIDQRFKYTGKEEINDLDLNWQDFGARMYDATLGRWGGVDALSEMYSSKSTYHYSANNPINNVDIDGRSFYQSNFVRQKLGPHWTDSYTNDNEENRSEELFESLSTAAAILNSEEDAPNAPKGEGDPNQISTLYQKVIGEEAMNQAIVDFVDKAVNSGRTPRGVKIKVGGASQGQYNYPEYFGKEKFFNVLDFVDFGSSKHVWGEKAFKMGNESIIVHFAAEKKNRDASWVSYADDDGNLNSLDIHWLKGGPNLALMNSNNHTVAFAIFNSPSKLKKWKQTVFNKSYNHYTNALKKKGY